MCHAVDQSDIQITLQHPIGWVADSRDKFAVVRENLDDMIDIIVIYFNSVSNSVYNKSKSKKNKVNLSYIMRIILNSFKYTVLLHPTFVLAALINLIIFN